MTNCLLYCCKNTDSTWWNRLVFTLMSDFIMYFSSSWLFSPISVNISYFHLFFCSIITFPTHIFCFKVRPTPFSDRHQGSQLTSLTSCLIHPWTSYLYAIACCLATESRAQMHLLTRQLTAAVEAIKPKVKLRIISGFSPKNWTNGKTYTLSNFWKMGYLRTMIYWEIVMVVDGGSVERCKGRGSP